MSDMETYKAFWKWLEKEYPRMIHDAEETDWGEIVWFAAVKWEREKAAGDTKPVVYLDEGLSVFYWPKEYDKLSHKGFVGLYARPNHGENNE